MEFSGDALYTPRNPVSSGWHLSLTVGFSVQEFERLSQTWRTRTGMAAPDVNGLSRMDSMPEGTAFVEAALTLSAVGKEIRRSQHLRDHTLLRRECEKLLRKCQKLSGADACSIFLVQGGNVVLAQHIGYERPHGARIPFTELQASLRYKLSHPTRTSIDSFDGITGYVASTGRSFGADSQEEIRRHSSHKGKTDEVGIWDPKIRPFRCMFALPIKMPNGNVIGVLKVENKKDSQGHDATFDEGDKRLLQALVDWLCVAIEDSDLPSDVAFDDKYDWQIPEQRRQCLEELAFMHDRSSMKKVIEGLPKQIETSLDCPIPHPPHGQFSRILLIGLGGSALPADILVEAFGEQLLVPVTVSRHYSVPPWVDSRTLVIASSFSGETEEVLASLNQLKAVSNVVALAGGGELAKQAASRGIPLLRVPVDQEPPGFQPRLAFGYMATLMVRVLSAAKLIGNAEEQLADVPGFLRGSSLRAEAEDAAWWLGDRIPVIYTDPSYVRSIARIAKIKFNENSKRPAFFNELPEANHNEMIGFTRSLADFGVLYLHDPESHPRIRHRYHVMRRVFSEEGLGNVAFREWTMPGTARIQKIFAALMFADWCSYTRALLDGLDPTPVELVERFKKRLDSPAT